MTVGIMQLMQRSKRLLMVNEITYIKKYYKLFDSKISNFVNSNVLEQEIEQNFQQ